MNLRSHEPYWLLKSGLIKSYSSLTRNATAEVAIIGAGITGALVAWHLCRKGFRVIVLDKRHVGMGSTAASTSLLQYEIDVPLIKLAEKIGEKKAVQCYQLCVDSIKRLQTICNQFDDRVGFERKPSFQYASFKNHIPELRQEFELRRKNQIEVRWLEEKEIQAKFGLSSRSGILSGAGAQVDAYRLTHALLSRAEQWDAKIFNTTEVVRVTNRRDHVILKTKEGHTVKARHLIIACGYESQKYLPHKKVERFDSTYAIASEPHVGRQALWYRNCLIWETATPYLYLRTTSDNRIMIGGCDDAFSDPRRRSVNLPRKVRQLEKSFARLFPDIPFKTDFQWAGTFARTRDGLPYIGSLRSQPSTSYALGFGGNGIVFSVIAAKLLADQLSGKPNKNSALFSFDR